MMMKSDDDDDDDDEDEDEGTANSPTSSKFHASDFDKFN